MPVDEEDQDEATLLDFNGKQNSQQNITAAKCMNTCKGLSDDGDNEDEDGGDEPLITELNLDDLGASRPSRAIPASCRARPHTS